MVFQSYALYPHMNVDDNMAFGLELAKLPKAGDRRSACARRARCCSSSRSSTASRAQLSGGQRQRVAIGRAIVRDPKVFLFDEPLSNLDAALRVQMRIEIAKLHARLGATMIYVTHDQVEAMTLADKIVVLNAGRIEQVGTPLELYHRPANLFVAGFIGSPQMNFIQCRGRAASGRTRCGSVFRAAHLVRPVSAGRSCSRAKPSSSAFGRITCRWGRRRASRPDRPRGGARRKPSALHRYRGGPARDRPSPAMQRTEAGSTVSMTSRPAISAICSRRSGEALPARTRSRRCPANPPTRMSIV